MRPRHHRPPRWWAHPDTWLWAAGCLAFLAAYFGAVYTGVAAMALPAETDAAAAPQVEATDWAWDTTAATSAPMTSVATTPSRACRCTVRTPLQEDTSWQSAPAAAAASGQGQPKPTAAPATTTSAPSTASTVTAPPGTVSTPQESPREGGGTFSGTPQDPSGTPGSSTPTESTPSTQSASSPPTQPEGTDVAPTTFEVTPATFETTSETTTAATSEETTP